MIDLKKLVEDLKLAHKAKDADDGGSCNFDAPAWHERESKALIAAVKEAGGDTYKWRKESFVLNFPFPGQAQKRTVAAERMCLELREKGYPVGMYYQVD